MSKLQNYVNGHWVDGQGEGVPLFDSVTGEIICHASAEGLNFGEIMHYGRTKGGEKHRRMTFQERGNMNKKLALQLQIIMDHYNIKNINPDAKDSCELHEFVKYFSEDLTQYLKITQS